MTPVTEGAARRTLLLGILVLASCQSSKVEWGELPLNAGLPYFETVDEAIAFVLTEDNIGEFKGTVGGSEAFFIELPSGRREMNWTLNCYFSHVFKPFGEAAYPELAGLLNHEHEFVRVGMFSVLNSYMHARGIQYNPLDFNPRPQPEANRVRAIARLLETLRDERPDEAAGGARVGRQS